MALRRFGSYGLILALTCMSLLSGCTQSDAPAQIEGDTPDQAQTETVEAGNVETEEAESEPEEETNLFEFIQVENVDSARAVEVIRTLASEKYEGRKAGMETNVLAEDYIVSQFEEIGLETPDSLNGYKQLYPQKIIYPVQPSELSIVGSEEVFEYQIDFTERSMIGRSYYDADLTAGMIVVNSSRDLDKDPSEFDGKVALMSTNTFYNSDVWGWVDDLQEAGVNFEGFFVSREVYGTGGMLVNRSLKGDESDTFHEDDPFVMHVSMDAFDKLAAAAEEGKEVKVKLDYEVKQAEPANIVGIIPGKNEDGEGETLIIGAHMDHVGSNLNGTYNPGALDNASGVAVLLEMARSIKAAGQPENTIVFVAFNGEEDGLRGSRYFVEHPPVEYDPEATVMLNFDMVGSKVDVPLELITPHEVSFKLRRRIHELAQEMDIRNISRTSGGSDHVPFSEAGIPSILLIHFDDTYYHTYLDTIENTISEERLDSVIKLGLAYVDEYAYQDEPEE